jgi:phosphate transport system substrate-binding protein
MRKILAFAIRLFLTISALSICIYILNKLDFLSQLAALDNILGALPLILLLMTLVAIVSLIWILFRSTTNRTLTIILLILAISCIVLFVPSLTGNWYFLDAIRNQDSTENQKFGSIISTSNSNTDTPDLTVYAPFTENSKVATLSTKPTIHIDEDLPVLDGATALYPVYSAFANATYNRNQFSPNDVACNNTANAYERIIKGDCDIIFVAGPSAKQKQAAKAAGANLIYTPIGKEAFVFLTGKTNPIKDLTYQQIKNIYSGKTAKWRTLGWDAGGDIIAFKRPEGSGSQTGLENIMGELPIQKPQPLPDESLVGKGSMLKQVSVEWKGVQSAIGYSYRYYAISMYPNLDSKLMKVNGVYPSDDTIASGAYPFTAEFYAVTNGKPTGNTKKLIDWILSEQGQFLIKQTGYVLGSGTRLGSTP